jgi:hypothetical protein
MDKIVVRKTPVKYPLGARTVECVEVRRGLDVLLRGYVTREGLYHAAVDGEGMSRKRFVAAMQKRFGEV